MYRIYGLLRLAWKLLRELCGENNYERYRVRAIERGASPLSREAFFLDRLKLKYARPNRCC